jgi:predicted membrane channel-forming protein YqfA (hemolysin III family)
MEWGKTNTAFVFETEYYLFVKTTDTRSSFTHPLILIPLLGQLCILFSLFSKRRSKILVFAGMILMSVLVLFIFLAGILSLNVKMISSCLPFILLSIALIRIYRKH